MRTSAQQIVAAFALLASIGIFPHSTKAERKAAMRAFTKANHPDAGGDTERFAAVNGAFQTIANVEPVAKPEPRAEQPKAKAKPEAEAPKADAKPKAEADAGDALATRRAARALAAKAVHAYYTGASLPFKAAADTFKPLNFDNAKAATQRQAALLASMLCAGDCIQADGTFIRGGFTLPDTNGVMRAVQPESGCLGNMLNRVVTYVSGPTSGAAQRDTVLRVNLDLAAVEIQTHLGGALSRAALARIAELQAATA